MDLIFNLATTFWQWSIFVALVIIGYIFSRFDGQGENRVGFVLDWGMPVMKPIPIATKDKGFWRGIFFMAPRGSTMGASRRFLFYYGR